jgi:hypothetical protein
LEAVSVIFNQIRDFRKLSSLSTAYRFFTAENPMYFALAEQFVSIFVHNKMLRRDWEPLRNFSAAEKCALIARQGAIDCGLSETFVGRLKELRVPPEELNVERLFLRPINRNRGIHVPEDDMSGQVEIAELHHIVLELRKLPLQPSPSSVLCVLANSIQMLTSALRLCAGQSVGADEIFQFFVFCVSLAKLWCLPALVSFVDTFIDEALRETKFEYYIEQLRSSLEFIDNRFLPVQPFVIFPVPRPPARLAAMMKPTAAGVISIKGFEVYALPTWSPARDKLFPAMIRYTGTDQFAKCYQFVVSDTTKLDPGLTLEAIATLHGTFLQLTPERIEEYSMIRVDDGDYVSHIEEIAAISAMMKMAGAGPVLNSSVGKMAKLYEVVRSLWRLPEPRLGVAAQIRIVIQSIQQALVDQRRLPRTFIVDGSLDIDTLAAIEQVWAGLGKHSAATPTFPCAPRVFKAITESAKRIHRISSHGSEGALSELESDSK